MTDVLVYWKDYRPDKARSGSLRWHSNHRVFGDLLPGDRLWVVTSGKSLGKDDENAGYLVAVWPVAQVEKNPGDDPKYPARKYQHRVMVNETEAIQLDQPVCVDHIIRREGYGKDVSVGRFLRGPRRLTDEKVRQLRSAAGPEMAQKWLVGGRKTEGGRLKKEEGGGVKNERGETRRFEEEDEAVCTADHPPVLCDP